MTDPDLPRAELDVMSCLWNAGSLTARDVRERLESTRPMAHASLGTLLKRLEDKGLVERTEASTGKAFVYKTRVAPVKTQRRLVKKPGGSTVRWKWCGDGGFTAAVENFNRRRSR